MAKSQIIAVVGATGTQGRSVINNLAKDGTWEIRGLTRNIKGAAAEDLASMGIEIVQADLNDIESLKIAFKGVTAIYGVTNFFEPFALYGSVKAEEIEYQQGINIALAASQTSSLEHYIWSTTPRPSKISRGKFYVPHFEAKSRVDEYIRNELPELLKKTTFLWIGSFAANFNTPPMKPTKLDTAGTYLWLQPIGKDVLVPCAGDEKVVIGTFVNAILKKRDSTRGGLYCFARSKQQLSQGDILDSWSKATGHSARLVKISVSDYDALWPGWGLELGTMMQFWEEFGEAAWSAPGTLLSAQELDIEDNFATLQDVFAKVL